MNKFDFHLMWLFQAEEALNKLDRVLKELVKIDREVGCSSCYDCIHCRMRRERDMERTAIWKEYNADPVAFDEETDRMFAAIKRRDEEKKYG